MEKGKKLFRILLLVLIFSCLTTNLNATSDYEIAPDGQPWINSSIPYWTSSDPNLNADWDWRQEHYDVYWDRPPAALWTVASPFSSEYTSGVALTLDYEPEDGWVLLSRNFGSDKNYLRNPYFILYNKYTGLLRVFLLLSVLEHYTTGSVSLSFDSALPNTTALLTHASHRAWAVDKYKEDLISYGVTEIQNGHWAYADFVTAYDPNTEQVEDSAIRFRLEGVNITEVSLSGGLSLTQVLPKSGVPAESNTYDLKNLVTDGKRVIGYYNTFQKYQTQFKTAVEKQKNQNLKQALTEVMGSWVYQNLPYIGVGIGLVDLFIGGGRKKKPESPVPMVFSGDLSLTGTMKERNFIAGFSMQTPGAIHKNPNFIPLYDRPLGIFNLRETPILGYKNYWQEVRPGLSMKFNRFWVHNELDWVVNPDSGLKLKELKAAIVFRLDPVYTYPYDLLPVIPGCLSSGIYEVESSTDGKYVLRTRYMPFYQFKDASIYVPPGTDVTIKVKAVLERKDAAPGTQDVLFIADYEPFFDESLRWLNLQWSPYQLPSFPDDKLTFENGGFEMGLSYWETYGDGNGYGTVEEGVEGVRSAYIARGQATHQFFGYTQRGIPCEPNTIYRLSLWVKAKAKSGVVAAGLGNWGSPNNTHQDFGWTGGYSEWKQITGTWTSRPDETTLDIVLYGTPDFSGEAYFDSVILEKVGPAPLEVDLEGPSILSKGESGIFVAGVSRPGSYAYQWYKKINGGTQWDPLGNGKTQTVRMGVNDFTLKVDVHDNQTGQDASATLRVKYAGTGKVEKK